MAKITVLDKEITVQSQHEKDYISLTGIAKYKSLDRTDDLIRNWIRNRNTIKCLGIWERLNNPAFKPVEFDGFRKLAGLNSFTLTPKQWIEPVEVLAVTRRATFETTPMLECVRVTPANRPKSALPSRKRLESGSQ